MLRAVVRGARESATGASSARVQHHALAPTQQVAALTRQISSARFSIDRPMSKKETDACYSRIAAKLEKTNNAVSMDAIDRTVTYLQEIGLTKSLALSAVAMHPMMASYLVPTMDEKVNWLRANGVSGPLLVRAIARHPNILGVREQALLDVKEWYISQGVHPRKLPFLISVFPHAVSTSIRENLEPKRQFLIEQGLSHRQVVGVLQRCPQYMSLSLDCLESKVAFLKTRGLSSDAITKLIASTPEVLGLSPDSMDAKLEALDALLGSRDATTDAWSSNPRVIMCKSEPLARAYAYLVNVVGMPHERVVRNVGLIMRSVDRITRPRFEFLVKTHALDRHALTEKVSWIMISDSTFQERFPEYEGGTVRSATTAAIAQVAATAAV